MITTSSLKRVREIIEKEKSNNSIVGFVPTMGALHFGHISLVREMKKECAFGVVSIFVNPVQFGPKEDYKNYPRNIKEDGRLLKNEKVDLLFYPHLAAVYSQNHSTYIEETFLSNVLCGKSRPGHFKGVCTVVTKLFNIIQPDVAYFGQKDYQQAEIIKRMVKDLNFPVKIKVLPIIRENDGLALSSRNKYLNYEERKNSTALYKALHLAKQLIKEGERNTQMIITKMHNLILSYKYTKVDYIKIVNTQDLRDIEKIKGKILIALAVYVGKTRLIDNMLINAD